MTRIYLDHSATSPLRLEVEQAMAPYMTDQFGNPSSPHGLGARAEKVLRRCRKLCTELLGNPAGQVVFVSGGTEANNTALQGFTRLQDAPGHLITSTIEHPSTAETVSYLERQGWEVTRLAVDGSGRFDSEQLSRSLQADTRLVSVMWVNNEIGSIFPIESICATIQDFNRRQGHNVQLHVDAVQVPGHLPLDLSQQPIDMLSLSGHKLGGPKGSGLLWLRRGLALTPLMFGGPQELGMRPGTENVPAIVGLTKALQLAVQEQQQRSRHTAALREELWNSLADIEGIVRTTPAEAAPHILHVCVPGIRGEVMTQSLDEHGIAISTGAACSSKQEVSPVLKSIGLSETLAQGALRFSFGPDNTTACAAAAAAAVKQAVAEIRSAYGVWE